MIQSILSNLAIILMVHLLMTVIAQYKGRMTHRSSQLFMMSLVTVSVIGIFYLPIRLGAYHFDLRMLPLLFFAYFHGWRVVVIPLVLICLWNYSIIGGNFFTDILFQMVIPTMIALLYNIFTKEKNNILQLLGVVMISWFISDVPIIFTVANGVHIFTEVAFIRLVSFVFVTIIWYIFIQETKQRSMLHQQLERRAREDSLTELLNRRTFFEVVEKQIQLDLPIHFIAIIDLDYFKSINDTYGHVIGDAILKEFATFLKKLESPNLKVGRFGGEEFILYIGNSTHDEVEQVVEKLIHDIRTYTFKPSDTIALNITASSGLAKIENPVALQEAVKKADKNLYKAKASGRNCSVCF